MTIVSNSLVKMIIIGLVAMRCFVVARILYRDRGLPRRGSRLGQPVYKIRTGYA